MKTKYQTLVDYLNEKRTKTGLYSSLVRKSLTELLDNGGRTYTGYSFYRARGWAAKRIWTEEVLFVLRKLGIACTSGNNAPRGGANGEYVQVTCKAFVKQSIARRKELDDLERIKKEEHNRKLEEIQKQMQIDDSHTMKILCRSEVVDYIKNHIKNYMYDNNPCAAVGQLNGKARHLLSIEIAKSFPQLNPKAKSISRVLKTNIEIKKMLNWTELY